MRFVVTGRMIDQPVVPPEQEIAILKATFQLFAENRDSRIKGIYPHADEARNHIPDRGGNGGRADGSAGCASRWPDEHVPVTPNHHS